ncbi:MAG TPA: efflux RND transporter permease subunit, partial [Desulfobacterales bacterium]|nr:efflux RND transporter permease subunit [Desulfobacterales bacterium]
LYQDRSEILWSRIRLLLKNMSIGLALVGILLGLFLNLKLAFWVALGIPISFAAGLMCFPQLDVSINMTSLFAFIMVLGIVVDDAIVIGENVFRKRQRLEDPLRASIEGTLEVGRPVIFSVLTTVAAFWPLLLGSGIMGKFMRNIPIVVIIVLLGSLTEALLILPAHLARSKFNAGGNANKTRKEIISKALNWVISEPYRKILNYCLRWRYASAAVALTLLLLATGLWTGRIIKFTLFPKVESDVLMCNLTMPAGTPLTKTQQMVKYLEDSAILALGEAEKERPKGSPPLLRYMASLIGAQMAGHGPRAGSADTGGNLAQIFIQLLGEDQRKISATKLLNLWRKKAGPIPEAESLTFRAEFFSPGNPIEVHLSLDDEQMLKRAVEDLKRELREYPGVYDINDSFIPGKKEIRIKLRPQGRDLGFNLKDLAQQVRFAFYGAEAMRFEREEDEVKVMVRYPEEQRSLESTLMHMRLRSPTGHEVPFSEVAQINIARGYSSIERAQRRRVIKVTADVDEEVANAHEIRSYLQGEFLPTLKNLYPGLRYSTEGAGKEEHESLSDVINGFLIALLAIYALLAIPLRSFSQPFVIMLAVPFSLVGAVVGHLVMGLNLSLLSLFGMVGLAGVAVNDSLVLVDAINRLRSEGRSLWEAVVMAGSLRFRPIVLTSVTTFAGLMPLILEKSFQAKFLIPMAVSLGFGVLFATGVTLIVIPCGYLILNDIKGLVRVKEKGI